MIRLAHKDGESKIVHIPRLDCNTYFLHRFYCPEAKWLMKEPCPFISRRECQAYKEACGSL